MLSCLWRQTQLVVKACLMLSCLWNGSQLVVKINAELSVETDTTCC